MRTKTITRLVTLSLGFLLTATMALGQGHSGGCTCGKFASNPQPWQIEHGSDVAYQNAAFAEFARWNNVANLFTPALGDGSAGWQNGKNEILYVNISEASTYWGISLDGDTFGIAPSSPVGAFGNFNQCPKPVGVSCGTFTEADVLLNEDFARGWTSVFDPFDYDDNSGPAHYGATAVHEIGHTVGMHHNFDNLSTMNYYEDYAARFVSIADAAAIRTTYASQAKTMTDMGTYPFYFDPNDTQYAATTPAVVTPTSVNAGGTFSLNNVAVENVGTQSLNDVKLEIYLSSDTTITSGDIYLGRVGWQTNPFPSLAFSDLDISGIPIQSSTANGTYYVGTRIVYNAGSSGPSGTEDSITYNNTFIAPQKLTVSGGTGSSSCTANSTTLCIDSTTGDKRFKIQVSFQTSQGGGLSGNGQAISLSSLGVNSGGLFTFFSADNPEVLVKVINGCAFNSRYWVFLTAGTNVGFTTTVTDTKTGSVKTYSNPDLTAAAPVQDTSAFATCP